MFEVGCRHLEITGLQMKMAFLEDSELAALGRHFCVASNARSCVPTVSPFFVGRLRLPGHSSEGWL